MKYYDGVRKQLVYISRRATPEYWDEYWNIDGSIRDILNSVKRTFISEWTGQYLRINDGLILEGGSGNGIFVASLLKSGYRAIGVDSALNTVKVLNRYAPELGIICGDVRKLPFRDNYFVGYWSLGVIEHFMDGYEDVRREMRRVIRENGYLFLTFPYMSPIRKFKSRVGCYEVWENSDINRFNQFALNVGSVIEEFGKIEFKLIRSVPHDVATGITQEIPLLKPVLQKLRKYAQKHRAGGLLEIILDKICSKWLSHCTLLIFKKSEKG